MAKVSGYLNKCSAAAEMGDRLATVDMGRKEGGCCAAVHVYSRWYSITTAEGYVATVPEATNFQTS